MATLLTGGTGFLGMELLVRAVDRDASDTVCVIRADDDAHAARRLAGTLHTLYGDDVPPAATRRLVAVAGDLERPGLGLSPEATELVQRRVTRIVHSAASISFDLPLDEARAVNVAGTEHVLAIAERLHAAGRLERHVHVSTAYVAGRHVGPVPEAGGPVDGTPRNTYEQTKREAELLVHAAAARGLPVVVARPSIVVGESGSGWTPAFNVLYWPLRALARGLLTSVPADLDGLVDVVPVDYVADAITHLATTGDPVDGTYHLTAGPDPLRIADLIELACTAMDCPRPHVEPPVAHAAAAGDDASHEAGVYVPYFDVHSRYDDRRARALLTPAGITCPPLPAYFDALVGYAQAARWGRAGVPRAQATAATRGRPRQGVAA
jgi:long-chain acyl-CoA synthetase